MSGLPSAVKAISLTDLIAFNEEVAALVRVGLPIEVGLGGAELPKRIGRSPAASEKSCSAGPPSGRHSTTAGPNFRRPIWHWWKPACGRIA